MKRIAIVSLIFACLQICYAENWATAKLESAQKADALAVSKIVNERAELVAKLDKISKEISQIDSEIKSLKDCQVEMLSIAEKSKFNDSILENVVSVVSRNFGGNVQNVVSFADAKQVALAELQKLHTKVFAPMQAKEVSVKRAKTDEVLNGKTFRVGKFIYFVGTDTAGVVSENGVLYMEDYADAIKDFYAGKTSEIVADFSDGAILDKAEKSRTIAEEIALGGIWMYPILFFGVLSILVCVFKIFLFVSIRRAPKDAVKKITLALEKDDIEKAKKIALASGYPYSKLLAELVQSRNLQASLLEEISYEHMLSAGEKLFGGLSVLSVTAAVAPLFGLLGTVTGIIKTFADLSMGSAEQAQSISVGISEALITTEYGLIVAIPAFVVHAILSRRAKGVLSDMEKLASSFLATNRS